ncbi:hypothetical protein EC988_001324, partial [Linderina pennispora]
MPLATAKASHRQGALHDTRDFARLSHFLHIFHQALNQEQELSMQQLEEELLQDTGVVRALLKRALRILTGNRHMEEKKIEKYIERAWERHLAGYAELPDSFAELGLYGVDVRERTRVVLETLELVFVRPDNLRHISSVAQQDAQQWRVEPVGVDSVSRTYWLLCGDRLYRETSKKSLLLIEKHNREAGVNSRRSTRLSEQRGPLVDPPRHDDIEDDGTLWELLCASYEEWVHFPNVLEQLTSKADRTVYRRVSKIAPGIATRLHSEIKKQELQELLATRKRSTRIAKKEAMKHQREIIEQEEQVAEGDYRRSKRIKHSAEEEEPIHPMLIDTRDLRAQRREQARLEALEREQMKKIEIEHPA